MHIVTDYEYIKCSKQSLLENRRLKKSLYKEKLLSGCFYHVS